MLGGNLVGLWEDDFFCGVGKVGDCKRLCMRGPYWVQPSSLAMKTSCRGQALLDVRGEMLVGTLQGVSKVKEFLGNVRAERTRGWVSQVMKREVGQMGRSKRVQVGMSVCWQEAIAHLIDLVRVGPRNGGCAKEGPVHSVEKALYVAPKRRYRSWA